MNFRTEITPAPLPFEIDLNKGALFLGSCFSDYMSEKLRQTLWNINGNPAGTLFNPASIANLVRLSLSPSDEARRNTLEQTLFFHDNLWRSYFFPTEFTALSENDCLDKCLTALSSLRHSLENAGILFLTFGTASVFELSNLPKLIVTNCHKLPADRFSRRLMSPEEIFSLWKEIAEEIYALNPSLKIVFTVSPVRHVRDGYHLNTLSKSTLHLAVGMLCDALEHAAYFPAYELIIDDLRDYRFFGSDLVHPTEMAVEYLREKLLSACFTSDQRKILEQGEKLWHRLNHRPLHPDSPQALQFKQQTSTLVATFLSSNPGFRL